MCSFSGAAQSPMGNQILFEAEQNARPSCRGNGEAGVAHLRADNRDPPIWTGSRVPEAAPREEARRPSTPPIQLT